MCLFLFKRFFMFLNLQKAVMFSAVCCLTMVICIVVVNSREIITNIEQHFGLCILLGITTLTWIIAFSGAHLANKHFILLALICWSFFIAAWILVGILSHISKAFGNTLCMNKRCGITMWLYSNVYHDAYYNKIDYFYHVPHSPAGDLIVRDPFYMVENNLVLKSTSLSTNMKQINESRVAMTLVILVISSLITLTLLYTSWALLYTYHNQLRCLMISQQTRIGPRRIVCPRKTIIQA